MALGFLVFWGVFGGMELGAWWMHKYLMHGPLWFLHGSHHQPRQGWFERNDWFGVFFSGVSMALFYAGTHGVPALIPVACGITAYGFAYFAFHDVLVHKRIRHHWRPKSAYLRRLILAHHVHHKTQTRQGCVNFGFLYAPPSGSEGDSSGQRQPPPARGFQGDNPCLDGSPPHSRS